MVTNQLYSTESYPHILESNRLKTGASAPFCQSTEGNCVYSRKRSLCSQIGFSHSNFIPQKHKDSVCPHYDQQISVRQSHNQSLSLYRLTNTISHHSITDIIIFNHLPKVILLYMPKHNALLLTLATLACIALAANTTYYICPNDYFFDLQHCELCKTNCICSAMGTCTSCIPGYTSYNGNCIQCPQSSGIYGTCSSCCSKTEGTQISCTGCQIVVNSYTFLYSGRCIVSTGCFEIDANGFCSECFPGFYQINNLCFACSQSCATCSDSTNCLTCANGYYWGVQNGGLCKSCPAGCSVCDSAGSCYGCLSAYYLFQSNCLSCPNNCKTCTDGSTCTSCLAGILVSNLCILCTELTYQGSVGCTGCVANNNFVKCTQCQDTYFLDANGVCQQCSTFIPGAIRCTNQNTPTQCQNDYITTLTLRYYLVGITCILNSKSCRYISDINGNCSQCYSGYTLNSGACVACAFTGCLPANASVVNNVCTCTVCNSGYYLTAVTCTACSTANCATCPANVCSACKANFYLSGSTCAASSAANCLTASSATLCSVCNSGYYKGSDNLCYACQSYCFSCTSRFVCNQCDTGNNYYLHSSGTCIQMPPNCLKLASNFSCILCSYGYYLYNGYCMQCKIQLGTLNHCQGLCPIDYYIQSLVVTAYSPLLWASIVVYLSLFFI